MWSPGHVELTTARLQNR